MSATSTTQWNSFTLARHLAVRCRESLGAVREPSPSLWRSIPDGTIVVDSPSKWSYEEGGYWFSIRMMAWDKKRKHPVAQWFLKVHVTRDMNIVLDDADTRRPVPSHVYRCLERDGL